MCIHVNIFKVKPSCPGWGREGGAVETDSCKEERAFRLSGEPWADWTLLPHLHSLNSHHSLLRTYQARGLASSPLPAVGLSRVTGPGSPSQPLQPMAVLPPSSRSTTSAPRLALVSLCPRCLSQLLVWSMSSSRTQGNLVFLASYL